LAIRVLPPAVAARIAAGEVIERPASIVKELIENALDAGASKIAVEITGGGVDSIRVTDDGCGIDAADLPTAFERHATSKLQSDEDLARILTLGFRGEALPSIAAVGEVEMVSRTPQAESAAWLRLAPDVEPEAGVRGAAIGTSISVHSVFARMPARRSFLRSVSSETNAVSQAVSHYALAYPEVRWSLTVDGRRTLETTGSGDLRDAVQAVYGADIAEAMCAIDDGGELPGVSGLVAPPHISRSTRAYISLFVNRRWIQNRRLTHAIEEAYQGLLMVGRHPLAVVNIRVPPDEVDVNVHPTKAEVRFRNEGAVYGLLQKRVRSALVTSSPVPTMSGVPGLALSPGVTAPPLWEHALRVERRAGAAGLATRPSESREDREEGAPAGPAGTPRQTLPALRVIGQFGNIYVIAEGPDGIFLIDQHAAHERVLYDRFCRERLERRPEAQRLLEAVVVDLTPGQRAAVGGNEQTLLEHGFEIEEFDDGSYAVRSLPAALAFGDVRENVRRFLDGLIEEPEGDRRDRVAMSLACHGAIRAGKQLAMEEMRDLVRQLEETDSPHTCPHGRPTMIHMGVDALAREFGRR
jgi:DNA mismatch repair protein MutL